MKRSPVLWLLLLAASPAMSDPASKQGGTGHKHSPSAAPAGYKEESPLPAGWPAPGPFDKVVRKKYPAYRAAFTTESSPNGGFRRLFKHIKRENIPMTAPVEMKLDAARKETADMEEMAFLYQSQEVGKTGAGGDLVEVRDIPAQEALSYAWQGARNAEATARARKAIDGELARLGLKAAGYRLLGYNSPFVPRARQTHELQAVLE